MNNSYPFGSFIKAVEFYTDSETEKPFLKVELPWWQLPKLWKKIKFKDVTIGTIYMDFEAETDAVTLKKLMNYFVKEANKPGMVYRHPLWQKNISENLDELEKGLNLENLVLIKITVREW